MTVEALTEEWLDWAVRRMASNTVGWEQRWAVRRGLRLTDAQMLAALGQEAGIYGEISGPDWPTAEFGGGNIPFVRVRPRGDSYAGAVRISGDALIRRARRVMGIGQPAPAGQMRMW